MLILTWLAQLALMVISVSAFHPYYPQYRCIEDGECVDVNSKRNAGDREVEAETHNFRTLRIKQRVPTDSIPHDIRMSRYLTRLTKKFSHRENSLAKRSNAYPIATAIPPTQTNSAGLDQDGTDYSYFAEVQFGSNATPLYMLMDTGASATWVMATTCTSKACLVHNTYGSTDSTTYKETSGLFDIAYGTGQVSGAVATDSVSFAGFTLSLTFGVANQTSDDFLHFPFDGIMGLARDPGSYPTLLETLSTSKVLKANIFGVNLDRNADGVHDGEINFGAPDISKYTGSLSYTPLASTSGDWVVAVDGVGVDGKSAGVTGRSAYIDTGTSYIFIPPADAKALHGLIDGSQVSSDGNTWFVPCSTTSSVEFTFSGVSYSVPSKDWVGGKSGGTLCTSNIYPGTPVGSNNWLLGDTFMKNVYTVFDSDQNRIGFGAKAVVTPSSTAVTSTATSGPVPTSLGSTGAKSNSTAIISGSSGSSGFNAAITSSSMSGAAASSPPSPGSSGTATQGSAGSRSEVYILSMSAILFATIVMVS